MATNIYNDILTQCSVVTAGLELSYVPPGATEPKNVTSEVRALPQAEEIINQLPLIAIVPHPRAGERTKGASMKNEIFVWYPVFVVLIAVSNQDFLTLLPIWLGWRQQIRQAFQPQTLKIASAYVWRVELDMEVPLPNEKLNQQYAYSGMGVNFVTIERRVIPVPSQTQVVPLP